MARSGGPKGSDPAEPILRWSTGEYGEACARMGDCLLSGPLGGMGGLVGGIMPPIGMGMPGAIIGDWPS